MDEKLEPLRKAALMRRGPTAVDMTYGAGSVMTVGDERTFPKYGMPARNAYQLIHDSLKFDGDPALNCATFLTTWMEPEAEKLIVENLGKNRVDLDEYEATERIHQLCVSYLHDLWNGPSGQDATGTVVAGSSEGIMLGGLAMKWRWRERRKAAGKDASQPNIVFAANAQVALEKTARYFDIEARLVPVSRESRYCLDVHKALEMIDENTIGMFVILGSTFTGHYEPVVEMSELLDKLHKEKGLDVPIHIDGASGAFVAPFAQPDLLWDFRVPRVVSISTSGHKFGLTYPGIGWVVWRTPEFLPSGLTFELSYLSGMVKTFTLNFSSPACYLLAQYYQFIRFGREGYTRIMNGCLNNARLMSVALEATGVYECISDIHRPRGMFGFSEESRQAASKLVLKVMAEDKPGSDPEPNSHFNYGLPEVAFRFADWFIAAHPEADQDVITTLMRVRGWIIPNYPLPPDVGNIRIMRVVVKEASTEDFVDRMVRDIVWATQTMLNLEKQTFGEAMLKPLPAKVDTSRLANAIAHSNTAAMSNEQKRAHLDSLLHKIGEHKDDSSRKKGPKMALSKDGSSKTVYEKSC
ncbi:glutamate decarboxylase gad1 [Coemansia javaensis]|uniref:Glutamate decarboxylase n=1 Tax=Coemansia javaensis TaxID=2761396 RepID=A0A9W8HKB0_9FUNG|nr:glutamate decarboxylase gad1 [Coemansia javaensis]